MKTRLFFLSTILLLTTQQTSIFAQSPAAAIPDKKMVLFKAITTDSAEVSGFLKEFDAANASLYYYEPGGDSVARLSAEEIQRIAYFKTGSFGKGFSRGFLTAEGLWTLYVLTKDEGYFGRGFDWVVGTTLLVTPVATVAGLLGAARGLSLDYEVGGDAEKFVLPAARLEKYSYGRNSKIVVTDKGRETLGQHNMSEVAHPLKHPSYSPRFHVGVQYGYGFLRFGREAALHYPPLQGSSFSSREDAYEIVWTLSGSYSPSPRWEVGYGHQFESGDQTELEGLVNDYAVSLSTVHYQSVHKLQMWYHVKPVYRAVGNRLQLSVGSAVLLSNSYTEASVYASSLNGGDVDFKEVSTRQLIPGLGLMGKGAVFFNPSFSFELSVEQYLFARAEVGELRLEDPIGFTGAPFSTNPNVFSVNFGIRYHY